MKIVAGLGCIDDYVRFVKAGADEFFCGYVPFEWTKKYGVMLPLNRREVLYYNVQIGSLEELRILKRMVDEYQVPVKITFNSLFYLREQYELIEQLMNQCIQVGFDTFIVADLALLMYLRERKLPCKIHLSGENSEVNHLMMEVMNQFHVNRYIFHRKNTIEDMRSCIQKNPLKNMEYEAFILNEWCHFTGGFCNSLHCDELTHLCKVPYQMRKAKGGDNRFGALFEKWQQVENEEDAECDLDSVEEICDGNCDHGNGCCEDEESDYMTGATGCGLCALKKLKTVGVTHLKLVGRGNFPDMMEKDIRQLKNALQIAEQCVDTDEYIQRMKKELFPNGCSGVCYYRGE